MLLYGIIVLFYYNYTIWFYLHQNIATFVESRHIYWGHLIINQLMDNMVKMTWCVNATMLYSISYLE